MSVFWRYTQYQRMEQKESAKDNIMAFICLIGLFALAVAYVIVLQ